MAAEAYQPGSAARRRPRPGTNYHPQADCSSWSTYSGGYWVHVILAFIGANSLLPAHGRIGN